MKTNKRSLFRVLPVMVAAALFMVSCSSGSDEGAFIPKNATGVMHFNVASLCQKADLANADNLQMMKSLHESLQTLSPQGDKMVEAFMKDPSSCGIDFKQPVCAFSEPFPISEEDFNYNTEYSVVSAKIKNVKDFDKFIADLEEVMGEKFKHRDTLGMTALELGESELLAYDSKRLFFIENVPIMISQMMDEPIDNVLTSTQYLAKLLSLKKDESLASDKNFAQYLADRKDISYYLVYGNMLKITVNPAISLLNKFYTEEYLKQFEHAAMGIYGSFENGRIEVTTKAYGYPEELKKFGVQKFNDELLAYLPAQTLAAITLGLDLKATMEFFDKMNDEDKTFDEPLGIKEYTLRDLVNALGGSLAATFYGMQEGTPYFAAAVDVKDSKMVRDLLNEMAVNNGNVYTFDFFPAMQLVLNDKVAVLSTDPAVIANAQAGGKSNGLMAVADKAKKGNYFYMDLNLEDWPKDLLALIGLNGTAVNSIVFNIFAMFDRIECETVDSENGLCNIYLSNDKINSLAYILQQVDKMI